MDEQTLQINERHGVIVSGVLRSPSMKFRANVSKTKNMFVTKVISGNPFGMAC